MSKRTRSMADAIALTETKQRAFEAIATCLEDDAAIIRDVDGWEEIPTNMEKAAQLIRSLAAQSETKPAAVPDECRDTNHHERYRAGWNACRRAMLAAAQAQGEK